MPCLVVRMLKMHLTVDTLMVPPMADTPKVLGLMRVCLNPRGATYLMQVLLEKRTMKVFRGGTLTQVLMAHCLTQVQWGEALVLRGEPLMQVFPNQVYRLKTNLGLPP